MFVDIYRIVGYSIHFLIQTGTNFGRCGNTNHHRANSFMPVLVLKMFQ
jgi:hypothetical protein